MDKRVDPDSPVIHDPWEQVRIGWPLGAVSLAQLTDRANRLHGGLPLPARLLNSEFLDRPWPTHPLEKRVIDMEYAEWAPPLPPEKTKFINIVDETELELADKLFLLRKTSVTLVNLGLLVSRFLYDKELQALGGIRDHSSILFTQQSLNRRFGFEFFERTGGGIGRPVLSRISPCVRFVDLRG